MVLTAGEKLEMTSSEASQTSAYTNDFLLNILTAKKARIGIGRTSLEEYQVSSSSEKGSFSDKGAYIVSGQSLYGDLFIIDDKDVTLNYATVGTLFLRDWFRAAWKRLSTEKHQKASEYLECRLKSSHTVDENLLLTYSEDVRTDFLGVAWAVTVAYEAMVSQTNLTGIYADAERRIFFRRFCHIGCGNPLQGVMCNEGVSSSPFFARTFECDAPAPPKC